MLRRRWAIDLQQYRRKTAECNLGKARCDGQGNVYVADPVERAIYKFGSDGNLLFTVSGGRLPGSLKQPRDVAIDSHGNIFVADPGSGRVARFDKWGQWQSSFTPEFRARGIAVDQEGFLYLHSLTPRWLVHKYSPQGERVVSFATGPKRQDSIVRLGPKQIVAPGYLDNGGSIAVDRRNHIYFASEWTYRLQRFSAAGRLTGSLRRWTREKRRVAIVDGKPYAGGTMVIWDIAIPPNKDRVYVLRTRQRKGHSLVDVWTTRGRLQTEMSFDHLAHSLACDHRGNLYLLYSNITERTARLLKYSPER